MLNITKSLYKELLHTVNDLIRFFRCDYKKPLSYLFNFIIDYQSIRINIDSYFTNLYQKKFILLEKSEVKKKRLIEIYENGVIKIEKFIKFNDKRQIIHLIDNGTDNNKILEEILRDEKKKIIKDIMYYLSFFRGQNFYEKDLDIFFISHKDTNANDEVHSDVFCHSPKAYIYLNDIDNSTRPFIYYLKSHKDYEIRKKIEKISNNNYYKNISKFKTKSPRLREHDDYQTYLKRYEKFIGLANSEDVIIADTSGFHCKGSGTKPRYALWIETSRDSILKKLLSFFTIRTYLSSLKK